VFLLATTDEPSLAATKKRQPGALTKSTSTSKNRVWGFEYTPSGRPCVDPQLSWEKATGSVQFTYETASGRAGWLSRDPYKDQDGNDAEIALGSNLYGYVVNDPINKIDPLGLFFDPTGNASNTLAQAAADDPVGYAEAGAGVAAAGAAIYFAPEAGAAIAKNVKIDGPGTPGQRGGSRLCQLRVGSTPIVRLDCDGKSLHLNIGPGSTNLHVPIWPPGAPYFGPK
jgi:RHS repeat-associated protein